MINAHDDRMTVMLFVDNTTPSPKDDYLMMWCEAVGGYIGVSKDAVRRDIYLGGVMGKVKRGQVERWRNLAQLGYEPVEYCNELPLDEAVPATTSIESLRLFREEGKQE